MTYKLLDGRIVEDENDERLTKKFGNTYSYFKNQHPDLYKLPEEEVGEICRRYNQNPYGDTHEKAVARTNNYINNQMPRWQQQYFNKPRQTRTTCAWGTIEQPKAPKQTQPMMTTFSGKPLKQHSLADLDGTKEMYKQMSLKPAPAPKPAPQPKAPQMMPMPQMPQMTPMSQMMPMPQMQTPTPWATGQTGFVKPKIKTMAERQEKLYNNPQAENNYYLMPMTNKYQSYPKLNPYLCAGNQFLQGLSLGWSDELNGASAALYNAMNETIPDSNSFMTMTQNYTQNRDNLRQYLAACENQHPKTSNASKRFGNILTSIAMKSSPIGAFAPLLIPYIKYMGEK